MRTAKEFFTTYYDKINAIEGGIDETYAYCQGLFAEWYKEADVGDKMHIQHWSDITPCTVVRRTKAMLVVRIDKGHRAPDWKPEYDGMHCINNDEQRWIIEDDPTGDTEVFRWSKRNNCWCNSAEEKALPDWMMKYDYNF